MKELQEPKMPRNEDGEMELVLGNRQLLSVMFILVVLLGVFFTMGYIVGRNNPSEEKIRVAAAKQQASAAGKLPPLTVDPSGAPSAKPSPSGPERTPVPPEPDPMEPAKSKEDRKAEAKQEKKEPPPAKPAPAAGSLFVTTPNPGTYLQVAAIDRPGASGMADAYRRQGFSAFITNSSSPTLFRVIIGPLSGAGEVADTKQKLKKIGVDGAILRKF